MMNADDILNEPIDQPNFVVGDVVVQWRIPGGPAMTVTGVDNEHVRVQYFLRRDARLHHSRFHPEELEKIIVDNRGVTYEEALARGWLS